MLMLWDWRLSVALARVRARKAGSCLMILTLSALLAVLGCGGGGSAGGSVHPQSVQDFVFVPTQTAEVAVAPVQQNGALGTPAFFAGPAFSAGAAASSSSHGFFVADHITHMLFAFNGNQAGKFLPAPGSPFSLSTNIGFLGDVAVRPDGKFAYVLGESGGIVGLSINSDGSLAAIPGSPFPVASGTVAAVTDSSGALLFAVGAIGVSVFTIDSVTGALTSTGIPVVLPGAIFSTFGLAAASPSPGNFLYVALSGSNSVAVFSFDSTGKLLQVNGSPFAAGKSPLTLTATAQTVYVMNSGDNTISALALNSATGALTPINGSPFNAQGGLGELAVLHGRFLYVPGPGNGVTGFSIDGTGALAPLAGSPFPIGEKLSGTVSTF